MGPLAGTQFRKGGLFNRSLYARRRRRLLLITVLLRAACTFLTAFVVWLRGGSYPRMLHDSRSVSQERNPSMHDTTSQSFFRNVRHLNRFTRFASHFTDLNVHNHRDTYECESPMSPGCFRNSSKLPQYLCCTLLCSRRGTGHALLNLDMHADPRNLTGNGSVSEATDDPFSQVSLLRAYLRCPRRAPQDVRQTHD